MNTLLPICCASQSFQLLATHIDSIESPDALIGGAIAISMHALHDVDPAAIDAKLQHYADTVRCREL